MEKPPDRLYLDCGELPLIVVYDEPQLINEIEYVAVAAAPQPNWDELPDWVQWASPKFFRHGSREGLLFTWMCYENIPKLVHGNLYDASSGNWGSFQNDIVPLGMDYRLIGLQARPKTMACSICGKECKAYKTTREGSAVCFECHVDLDKQRMIDGGKAVFCLAMSRDGNTVSNEAGTLVFPCGPVRTGNHSSGVRYDVSFDGPDGFVWQGTQYGRNTNICHCKRTRIRTK
jgi:hypothetical protein